MAASSRAWLQASCIGRKGYRKHTSMQTAHSSTWQTGEHPESEIRIKSIAVCETGSCGSRNERA